MDNIQPGQNLGAYRIVEQIGKGGMATVYKGYQAAMDRFVAIKVLPRQLADSPEFSARFRREARTIANLEHPHILPVYDSGESDGVAYLVMRYLEAGTLKERMDEGPLTPVQVDRYFSQLADGLGYAHRKGVIHRDLKPSNALVDAQDNLFLTDFGIAKLLEDGGTKLTATGGVIGTPTYMSPEQGQGRPVDQRSDIYSLGVVLYEMVTGKVPYEAETPLAVILQHMNEPLPLPSKIKPGLSPTVEQVILKALAKNPDDRYASATEFLEAWKAALASSPTVAAQPVARAVPSPAPGRPATQTVLAGATATVAAPPAAGAAPATAAAPRRGAPMALIIGGVAVVLCLGIAILVALGGFALGQFKLGPTAVAQHTAAPSDTTPATTPQAETGGSATTPVPASEGGGSPATSAPAGPVATSPDMNLPAGDQFTIAVGDAVSNGKPGAGAGNIEKGGGQDVYLFSAKAGQTVYFQVTPQPKISDSIRWQLVDDAGTKVFDTCLQCGDPGDQTLDKGGTYAIVVGNDPGTAPATGTYGFKLWDVPPAQQFTVNVGDEVSNGKPGPGAGNIEMPGVKDVYAFTATAGQTVYFQVAQPNKAGTLKWQLQDGSGSKLFDSCLQCGNPGDQTLDQGGVYTIIVGNDTDPASGAYSFKLWDVPPPQEFTINIGDQVSKDKPGAGAGDIETLGVKDVYTFTATPGQKVAFHITQPNKTDAMRWQLLDDAGTKLFDTCLQCGDPNPQTLDKGGQYQLIVGSDTGTATGTYGFQISVAP